MVVANRRKLTNDESRKLRDRDNKMVKGRFRNLESPGGTLKFALKLHKGDPVMKFSMTDGEVYDVPLMVAKHLNNNCQRSTNQNLLDAQGYPVKGSKKVRRFAFESLEFSDMDSGEAE